MDDRDLLVSIWGPNLLHLDMRTFSLLLFVASLISAAFAQSADEGSVRMYDVAVYGGTPGGIAAAVAAGRAGHSVLLIEPTTRIGGMMTNGLSHSDFRSFEALSGFFLEFTQAVEAYYIDRYGADSRQARESFRGAFGEPSVNLVVFERMLAAEATVEVLKGARLDEVETTAFDRGRRRLVAAVLAVREGGQRRVEARQFIDASYEGDLMAAAGEHFHVGRESRAQYDEPLAGNAKGQADGQVQGYNLRLIMTEREDNKIMPVMPAGYRREHFAGVLPLFAEGRLRRVFSSGHDGIYRAHIPLLPNEKADVNDTPRSPARLSLPELNDDYPTADLRRRAQIVEEHRYHNVGLLYFLQNDAEVPPHIQEDARNWGWCRDEFVETGGIPEQLYIREARRLVGQYVFTAKDTRTAIGDVRAVLRPDAIAIGDYIHNCHGTGRVGTRFDGRHEGEFYENVQPYQISYGVIVPQRTENLLVPVACSASHFGFNALRLESIWCSLGQAAGWAAHLAITREKPVQEVSVPDLQLLLHSQRSATLYVSDIAPDSPHFAAVQWFGLRGAFHGLSPTAEVIRPKTIVGQYNEAFPRHDANLAAALDPVIEARWAAMLPEGVSPPVGAKTREEWLGFAHATIISLNP